MNEKLSKLLDELEFAAISYNQDGGSFHDLLQARYNIAEYFEQQNSKLGPVPCGSPY